MCGHRSQPPFSLLLMEFAAVQKEGFAAAAAATAALFEGLKAPL